MCDYGFHTMHGCVDPRQVGVRPRFVGVIDKWKRI